MKKVVDSELNKVTGGISVWGGIAIAAAIVFFSGIVEGFTNPGRCDG